MELMKYSKVFALAAVFVLIAGCSGDKNTQEAVVDNVMAEEVHTNDDSMANSNSAEAADQVEENIQSNVVLPAINTIRFDFDKSTIRSEFYDVLNGHAAYLMANPSAKAKLEGHTDVRGSAEYNMALGERRGNSVERYLSLQGVSASQLEVISYGKMQLLDKGNTDSAHSQNRRVEINY